MAWMVNHKEQDMTEIFSLLKKGESLRIYTDGDWQQIRQQVLERDLPNDYDKYSLYF
jgi:uncharacterized protein (DUF2249 family)